jgi:2-succinyl-5-enolpyruvyl-6-hydroxy-3-cyclohexene-1-carboxylate synthase
VDNDGGGIFSFLPQARQVDADDFEQLFATPHGVDLAALARLHGLAARVVDEAGELGSGVQAGFEAGGVNVIVARTDRHANVAVHEEIHAAVVDSLQALDYRRS